MNTTQTPNVKLLRQYELNKLKEAYRRDKENLYSLSKRQLLKQNNTNIDDIQTFQDARPKKVSNPCKQRDAVKVYKNDDDIEPATEPVLMEEVVSSDLVNKPLEKQPKRGRPKKLSSSN